MLTLFCNHRRRPSSSAFFWRHQRKIVDLLCHPLFSIFVNRIEQQTEHEHDENEDDLGHHGMGQADFFVG
jgi:hypothetical protein